MQLHRTSGFSMTPFPALFRNRDGIREATRCIIYKPRRIFSFRLKNILLSGVVMASVLMLCNLTARAYSLSGTNYTSDGSVAPFYAADSFWNAPINTSAAVDPNSSGIMANSVIPYANTANFANGADWGIGLVYGSPTDKVYTIQNIQYYDYGPVSFPIPKGATPTTGSDHHLVVINGNRELDLWNARYDPATDTWSAGSAFIVDPNGWGANAAPGQKAGGAVAAGFSEMGGVVRPEEIAQGHIDHALSLTVPIIRSGYIAAPATATDGVYDTPNAMPEGAHLQLDPSFDVDAQNWPAWEKVIAKALQTYGAYVSDHGGSVAFYGQTDSNSGNTTWSSVGVPEDPSLSNIPWNLVRVLQLPPASTGTATGPESTGSTGSSTTPTTSSAAAAPVTAGSSPTTGTPPDASGIEGSGPDTLILSLSADTYGGGAQFTLTVDGQQVGGTHTVTATHSTGQVAPFTFKGNWGAGSHTIGISFINDAYDPITDADRNLYFESGTYDGQAFGTPTAQETNGIMRFTVPAATPASGSTQSGSTTPATSTGAPHAATVTTTTINGTNAANTLQGVAGQTLFNAEAGDDTVTAYGAANTIYGGAGNDTITVSGQRNWIDGGAGDDGIHDNGGNNTIVISAAGEGVDQIYGRVLKNGDLFDLRTALAGTSWNHDVATLPSYLHTAFTNGGADTVLSITPQGGGSANSTLAVLHGVGAVNINAFLGRVIST